MHVGICCCNGVEEANVPVVGDSVIWLTFWPVYLSAIASFGMIYFTYLSLQQNKKQLKELKHQREEERARLIFRVIVYKKAFMLKIHINIYKNNFFSRKGHCTNCLQIRQQLLSDPGFGHLRIIY